MVRSGTRDSQCQESALPARELVWNRFWRSIAIAREMVANKPAFGDLWPALCAHILIHTGPHLA